MRKFILYTCSFIIVASASCSFLAGCTNSSEEDYDELTESDKPFYDPYEFEPDGYVHQLPNVPVKQGARYFDRIKVNYMGDLRTIFLDSNKYQYKWAEKYGIAPIRSLGDAYRTRRPLVKIENCEAYGVDVLTHSMPYLVPEAAQLLKRIGYDFIDTLRMRGVDGYKIKVTSLLRTPASVKRLRMVNVNASDSSTHQFGTTFDISWSRFICADSSRTINEEDLKNVLAEVIQNLRKQGKCMVVFERKSPCFHITVTPGRKPDEM